MGILAVDELMLREPALFVPNQQPLGKVRVAPGPGAVTAGAWLAPNLQSVGHDHRVISIGGTVVAEVYNRARGWQMGGLSGVNTNYLSIASYFDLLVGNATETTTCISYTVTSLPNDDEKGLFHFGRHDGSGIMAFLVPGGSDLAVVVGAWDVHRSYMGVPVIGKRYTLVVGIMEGTSYAVALNGVLMADTTTTVEFDGTANTAKEIVEIGRCLTKDGQASYGDSFPGLIHYVHILKTRLPKATLVEWSRDPYQFLVPA